MTLLHHLGTELTEVALRWKRYFAYLAIAVALLVLAASLATRQLPVSILIFTSGISDEEQSTITERLSLLGGISVTTREGDLDLEAMKDEGAGLALGKRQSELVAVVNDMATDQPQALAVARLALDTVVSDPPTIFEPIYTNKLSEPERLSALPRPPQWQFIARIVALLSVFASFLVAFESYLRHAGSAHMYIILAARRGFAPYLGAKLGIAILAGLSTLSLLLLSANAFYGLAPKSGLVEVLVVYALASVISGALGLAAAALTGPTRQSLASLVGYFFVLIGFSGFLVPMAGAAAWVQTASYALPLRFPLAVLDRWLNGAMAFDADVLAKAALPQTPLEGTALELVAFLGLVPAALLVLMAAARHARSRF